MNKWRLILEMERYDGFYNMAVDEVLSQYCEHGESLPVLRIYHWKRPSLTIGYSQKTDQIIDMDFCREKEIDVIRRITGGKAVLHYDELTYSIVAPRKGMFPDTIAGIYKTIQRGLLRGITLLGYQVSTESGRPVKDRLKSEACFAVSYPHEINSNGKKIIGGALRRFKNSFLLHGSVLLSADVETLSKCFLHYSDKERERHKNFLVKRMAGLNDLGLRKITYEKLAYAVISGLKTELGIEMCDRELTTTEKKLAREQSFIKTQKKFSNLSAAFDSKM